MEELQVIMELERETKNCVRYDDNSSDAPPIGNIYIQKHALKGERPQRVAVSIVPLTDS